MDAKVAQGALVKVGLDGLEVGVHHFEDVDGADLGDALAEGGVLLDGGADVDAKNMARYGVGTDIK